ncbi:multi-sensor hybrid histidine kinase [Calothrix parasitica NIES-267]|uniref:Circadian input-output histidine kinase CikA n=1 Tax=Calothrix parasitica NIES-267 TaxID=1973488 RepID=A0A1Z4LL58_9CYAN|nr:multi-sensor hybrid histidine kinase [Calothrix parasitica NIES-267]
MKSDSHELFGGENILIVDDTLESLQSLSATLSENGYTVQSAISGSKALIAARLTRPNLILLDIKMPDIDGYEVCKKLKESAKTSDIPIIFLSCLNNVSEKIKAFKVGGADYITKPFQIEEVLARVKHQVTIQKLTRQIKEQNQQLKNEAEERRKAERDAVAASQAKTLFFANMSHELRTPLNAIIGFSKLMSDNSVLNAEQQENINIINRSAENLLAFVNDVLKFSKIELGAIDLDNRGFDLYHLLDNIKEMFLLELKQTNLKLNFIVAPNVPGYIYTDEKKLRSCLCNLIGNAIKFTPQGTVVLRVSFSEGEEKHVDFSSSPRLIFQVEDTGCGISFDELDDLFDAFAQADAGRKSLQGTGLGLTITRNFIRMMGGEIEVESILGKGSIFSFYIVLDISKNLDSQLTNSRVTYTRASDLNNEVCHASLLEDLMTMPHAWVLSLNQAANEVDEDLLQTILAELPENKASLSDSLTALVKDFRLDIIVDLTKQILERKSRVGG